MDKSWIIYGLFDPRDESKHLRYVGITTCGMGVRLCGHINYSKRLKTHRDYWIQSLIKESVKPSAIILEEGFGKESGVIAEQKWIDFYKTNRLTNSTKGGEGLAGYKHSEETKEKLRLANTTPEAIARNKALHSGKVVSQETKDKIAKLQKGVLKSEETKRRMSEGKSKPEVVAKARARNLSKVMSEESRAKMSASRTGKKQSPEAIEKVRQARLGTTMPEGALAKAWETRRKNKLLKQLTEGTV